MGLDGRRLGRNHEQLSQIDSEDVGDLPESFVGDAYFSPFDADDRPSVYACLKSQCLLGEISRHADFPDPCTDLLPAFLPSLEPVW